MKNTFIDQAGCQVDTTQELESDGKLGSLLQEKKLFGAMLNSVKHEDDIVSPLDNDWGNAVKFGADGLPDEGCA